MITLHLIRHGETVWHAENRYAGTTDVALTDRGRAQARGLEQWARAARLAVVATSDLGRAVETGRVVAAAASVPQIVDPGLREVDFGAGEGRTRAEMAELFPDALAAFTARPASSPLPGGELGADAAERGVSAICALARPHPAEATIAVVAHTTLIRLMLCRLIGLPLDDYRRRFPALDNTTVTTVRLPKPERAEDVDGVAALMRFNARVSPPMD